MGKKQEIKVGIGFATGRKSFKKVLRTYLYSWQEYGLNERENVRLHLFVAYDLAYRDTVAADYTGISRDLLDLLDDACFIGRAESREEIARLTGAGVISEQETGLLFRDGYATMRNVILYAALKNKIDYLVFLDDDEYPMAVTKTRSTAIWSGQHVLSTHLESISRADITNGYHCGYISPIPYVKYDDTLSEVDFRSFIEAISNDIINWENIQRVMSNGGVTYADTAVLVEEPVEEVCEINHAKFISGSNLCINLTDPGRVNPFYNPQGARGEDTFLGTSLSERKVLRVPCYTFHDGFSTYNHLMDGVLPISLKSVGDDSAEVMERFYRACVGWVRYKPLFLYITQPDSYRERIEEMRDKLGRTLPKICSHFGRPDFMNIADELERYHRQVAGHYRDFRATQQIWARIRRYLAQRESLT